MDEHIIAHLVVFGKLYAYSNESMPGVFKIGSTFRPIKERTAEANVQGTFGLPTPWKLVRLQIGVEDYEKKEKTIHKILAEKRINPRKEQFKGFSLEELDLYLALVGGKAINLNEIDSEHEQHEHERLRRQSQSVNINNVVQEVIDEGFVSPVSFQAEEEPEPSSLLEVVLDEPGQQQIVKVRINILKGSEHSKSCSYDLKNKKVADLNGSTLFIRGEPILNLSQFARLATQEYNRENNTTLKPKNYSHCQYSFDDATWLPCRGDNLFKCKKHGHECPSDYSCAL